MWRFCNDDKRLIRIGGRKAPLITRKEFLKNIKEYCAKDREIYEDELGIDPSDIDPEDDDVLYKFAEKIYYIRESDRSVMFDSENIATDTKEFGYKMSGIRILKNGLPILGVTAGGDWECPLFFCIYWDGKKFRLYVPRYGNTYNIVAKAAFGSEESGPGWSKYEEKIRDMYTSNKRFAIKHLLDKDGDMTNPELYTTIFGDATGVYDIPNGEAMEEDICNRIELI